MKRGIEWRSIAVSAMLFGAATASNAFPVVDLLAIPAAQVVSSNATSNSEKEQATSTANSNKQILENWKAVKDVMDLTHFFAKTPVEWAKTIRDYAMINTGWPARTAPAPALTAAAIQTAIGNALVDYDKQKNGTNAATIDTRDAYQVALQQRAEALGARNVLVANFDANNRNRAERMKVLEEMLNGSEMQRQFDVVRTYLDLEQTRFASEKATFDVSMKLLNEDAATKAELAARNRVSDFTDLRPRKQKDGDDFLPNGGKRKDLVRMLKPVSIASN